MISISNFLIFILFMIAWIQLPGMIFGAYLLPEKLKPASKMLASFFIGFSIEAVIYGLCPHVVLAVFAPAVIVLAGVIEVVRRVALGCGKKLDFTSRVFRFWASSFENSILHISTVVSFVLIYLVNFFAVQFWYGGAKSGVTTQIFHDYLFHTGNIASLSRNFPNFDIRVNGVMFYYHYFYELTFAMCKSIFKTEAYPLYMNGNALFTAWPLTLALSVVAELCVKSTGEDKIIDRRNALGCGLFRSECKYLFYTLGVLFTCTLLYPLNFVGAKLPFSWMNNHILTNTNSLGIALALNVVVIDILVSVWKEKFSKRVALALMLLIVAATGFKGTTGILLVAIAFFVFVIESLIVKKFVLSKLLYVASMAIGFVATYLLVVVGIGASGSNNRTTTLSAAGTLNWSRVGEVMARFLGLDYMAFPWVVIAIIGCVICLVGPIILPFSIIVFRRVRDLVKTGEIGDIFDWFVIGSALISIIAMLALTIEGMGQGYMFIGMSPLLFVLVIRYLKTDAPKLIRNFMIFFFACGILMELVDVGYYISGGIKQNAKYTVPIDSFEETVAYDSTKLYTSTGEKLPESQVEKCQVPAYQNFVSDKTIEAYDWLRENTKEDSLIAVDRHTENLDWRQIYFYCSAFSERQCYIEGFDYTDVAEEVSQAMLEKNEQFFSEDTAEAGKALKDEKIDYLVVTKLMHPDFQASHEILEEVYSNSDVTIYRVKGQR